MTEAESSTQENSKGGTPAYTPFATFRNFVGAMKERGLPPRIDKSVVANLSGSAQSVLLASLRALLLIADDGAVQPALKKLVATYGTNEWPKALGEVLDDGYRDMLGNLDLTNATKSMLSERFNGVGPSIREKSIRFLLTANEEASRGVSQHLKSGVSSRAKPARKPRTARRPTENVTEKVAESTPENGKRFTFPLRANFEAVVILPPDVKKADIDRLHAFLSILPFDSNS